MEEMVIEQVFVHLAGLVTATRSRTRCIASWEYLPFFRLTLEWL